MKKLLLTIAMLLISLAILSALPTGSSMMFSDSYMLRAKGSEAVYWNPALLTKSYQDITIPVLSGGFYIANNSLDLGTYNDFVGDDYLDAADKEKFLNKIDRRLMVHSGAHYSLYGITSGSVAYASSAHLYLKGSLSKKYLQLMLYGNVDSLYTFYKRNNNFSALAFTDVSMGIGDINIRIYDDHFPPIRLGLSGSLLIGGTGIHTKSYTGSFSSTMDGLSVVQDFTINTGVAGMGFKGMLGLASEPIPDLQVGLTLDNIFGFINWPLISDDTNYKIVIDSLYIANLSDDFYTETKTKTSADAFTTKIPPELRLAALYDFKQGNVSMDYVQGFSSSLLTNSRGRVAMGLELLATPNLPVHLGLGLGNSEYPWRVSYGLGFRSRIFSIGGGIQLFESLLPGYNTKGISLSGYFSYRI